VVEDGHPEAHRPAGDGLPDPPEADDADRRAVDVRPQQEHRAPGLPAAGPDVTITLGEPPPGGHEQGEGKVGGRVREDPWCVPDRDAPTSAGGHVDVVEADRVVRDDLELRPRPIEELVVDPVGEERQDAVAALDRVQQLRSGRGQVGLPDAGIAGLEDRRQPVVRDGPGDEDAGADTAGVGHGRP
jgi:hypothetical protein